MKPLDWTFLGLFGNALPDALVHARTHRSLKPRLRATPPGGLSVWQHDEGGRRRFIHAT